MQTWERLDTFWASQSSQTNLATVWVCMFLGVLYIQKRNPSHSGFLATGGNLVAQFGLASIRDAEVSQGRNLGR